MQERTLVPFFDSEEASDTTFQPLQPSRRSPTKPAAVLPGKGGHGLKRHAHERSSPQLAGSPPNKEAELVKARHQRRGKQAASAGSGSDTDASTARKPRASGPANGRKHQLDGAPRSAAPGGGSAQRQSPQRKSPDHNADLDMVQLAAASAAAATSLRTPGKAPSLASLLPSKFAGPAFTNSPTPDCLPIPTSSLLLQVRRRRCRCCCFWKTSVEACGMCLLLTPAPTPAPDHQLPCHTHFRRRPPMACAPA